MPVMLDGTGQQENCADDKYMGRQLLQHRGDTPQFAPECGRVLDASIAACRRFDNDGAHHVGV
jgi:hypothetical protein